jgi:hypothetical protein
VTITGSGFGAVQGNGQILLGTMNGVVQSWSDTHVVALVAARSTSGNAQVLQNGVPSNAIPFSVNIPQMTSVSPVAGVSGTSVTIDGAGFGSSQGSGTVWLGSADGQVVSWSDTEVVATVASTALTGIARVKQNGVWSNSVGFIVPAADGSTVTLTPYMLNLVVGDTRTIQASSSAGQPVTGLTWTSSDPTVVSLSTDDPPVLSALAAGHVTITAGGASADVTVSAGALPLGTVLWSNPGNGSGVASIVPAVPSPSGVADVFAFQNDGTVQAITSDGTTAWIADVSNAWPVTPDFQGGLVALEQSGGTQSIVKFDGITGERRPIYTTPDETVRISTNNVNVALHPDGTVFVLMNDDTGTFVLGIDSTTGSQKFQVPVPRGNVWYPFVAGDGYAYTAYSSEEYLGGLAQQNSVTVLRLDTSGASTSLPVFSSTTSLQDINPILACGMINNADNGIFLTWCDTTVSGDDKRTARISDGNATLVSTPSVGGNSGGVSPSTVLQAQDGSLVGAVEDFDTRTTYMIAFDQGGNVLWAVPDERPLMATDDGGVIGQSGITYDQSGGATGKINLTAYSWMGNAYQVGPVDQVEMGIIGVGSSFGPFAGGNPSANGSAVMPIAKDVRQLIAQKALSYIGSQRWLDTDGHYQCNIFVKDVLKEVGLDPPVSPRDPSQSRRIAYLLGLVDTRGYPAQAGDWASPGTNLKCWRPVTASPVVVGPQLPPGTLPPDLSAPGDVIAEAINYSDATGHVGIVASLGHTISADSAAGCISPGTPAGTIDDTDFGFRPDGWVDPSKDTSTGRPCRRSGLKRNAVVRRFVCQ